MAISISVRSWVVNRSRPLARRISSCLDSLAGCTSRFREALREWRSRRRRRLRGSVARSEPELPVGVVLVALGATVLLGVALAALLLALGVVPAS